jgi:hypothetical protein
MTIKNHEVRFSISGDLKVKVKRLYDSRAEFKNLKYRAFEELVFCLGINQIEKDLSEGVKFEHKLIRK